MSNTDNDRFGCFLDRPPSYKKKSYRRAGAGGIIIDANNNHLLVVKGTSKWSLPKGHLDKGEKYHQCAMREIREETNLDIVLSINDRYIDIKKCIYYIVYLQNSSTADIKINDPKEIQDVQWLPVEAIRNLNCNRQLEYVINKWDYINSIIKNHIVKVSKSPGGVYSPITRDTDHLPRTVIMETQPPSNVNNIA